MDFLLTTPGTLEKVVLWLSIGLPVAMFMELWAMFLHRYIWHGPLWLLHRSHHEPRAGLLERNDLFSILHASFAIVLILYGCVGPEGWVREAGFGFGLGMTTFGLSYMLIHDGLVHGRLPVAFLERNPWIHRLAAAHRAHHRTGHLPYGLFLGPQEARLVSRRRRALRAKS